MIVEKKICHITSVHIPFDTRIFYKECKSLAAYGYEVHLVAGYDKDELIDGIHLHAVTARKSKIKRMMFTTLNVYSRAAQVNAELYHFHDRGIKNEKYSFKPVPSTGYQVPPQLRYQFVAFNMIKGRKEQEI